MAQQSRKKKPKPTEGLHTPDDFSLVRELIVMVKPDVGLRATREGVVSTMRADVSPLSDLLATEGVTMQPLFGASETRLQSEAASLAMETGADVPDLSVYYRVEASDERLEELSTKFLKSDAIEAAYVKPSTEPANLQLNDMVTLVDEPPTTSPNFTDRQDYLGPAPIGIDAEHAWTVPGGRGAGINIIDIEWGWNFTHEDLIQNQGGVISGSNSSSNNHGTAVIGEFSGDRNPFGITGICPDAQVRAVSLATHSTAQAIRIAADQLGRGDIILLEVHRAGPKSGGGTGQFGYIAIEWWPDDFDAIRYAGSKGVLVVEAAGNGGQNLDDPIYDRRPSGFPTSWKNPFDPVNPSSGAVIVGAGLPPADTHGRNFQPGSGDVYADRGRCYFSNYGARVDAQGWGWEVTSTGYGDLQGGADRNQWYTDQFSGTSSASPIVVGSLACVQGVLRAKGDALLTPARAREVLRATGSPQQEGPAFTFIGNMTGSGYPQNHPVRQRTERIGNRPNLRQLIPAVFKHEVGTYSLLMISGYSGGGGNQIGFIYFYEPSGKYIGYAGIIKDGTPLPDNVQWPNGILNIYFHESELVALLDTLRNERPIFVSYHTSLKWGSVGTDREPVGEQEAPVTS